jgi:hypothetical protein
MTLVAGLSVGGLPAFLGDLLLSWRIPSAVGLPTQEDLKAHCGVRWQSRRGACSKACHRPIISPVSVGRRTCGSRADHRGTG